MLKVLALFSVLSFSVNSMACMGGRTTIGGKILLTSRTASLSPAREFDVNDMLNNGSAVSVYLSNGELVEVSVQAIKQDSQDIIFTIFRVKSSDEGQPRFIKVKSNYEGNGKTSRGIYSVDNLPIDETHGC